MLALRAWVTLAECLGLFLLLSSASLNKVKIIWAFVAGVTLQAGLGIYQFFTQYAFASKWLGMAVHDPSVPGTSVVEVPGDPGERWLRAYGAFPHPNILAAYSVIALLLALILGKKLKTKSAKLLLDFSFAILTIGLFFTFSRAAWIAFMVGLLSEGIAIFARGLFEAGRGRALGVNIRATRPVASFEPAEFRRRRWQFLSAAICATSIFLILGTIYFPLVINRVSGDSRLEVKSTTERLSSYKEAFSLIKEHPLFGVGVGNYTKALYKQSLLLHNNKNSTLQSWSYQPVHNVYILILSELGIIGFLFFLALLWRLLRTANGFIPIILTLLFLGLFDHYLWSLYAGVALFWLTFAFSKTFSKTAG